MISTLISSSINAGQFRCRSNEKSISNLDYIALCMVFNSSLISLTATLESDSIVIWHVLLKDDGQASVNSPNFRFQAWVTYVLSIVAQHPFAIWICEKTSKPCLPVCFVPNHLGMLNHDLNVLFLASLILFTHFEVVETVQSIALNGWISQFPSERRWISPQHN